MTTKNICVKFGKRPGVNGVPSPEHFYHTECEFPILDDKDTENDVSMIVLLHFIVR